MAFSLFFDPEISRRESHPWGMILLASPQPLLVSSASSLSPPGSKHIDVVGRLPTLPVTNQLSLSGPRAQSFLEVPLLGRTDTTSTVAFSLATGLDPGPLIAINQPLFSSLPFAIRPKEPLVSSQSQHQLMLPRVSPVKSRFRQ